MARISHEEAPTPSNRIVRQIVLERGLVDRSRLDEVASACEARGIRLEAALLKAGLISSDDLMSILAERDDRMGGSRGGGRPPASGGGSRFPGLASNDRSSASAESGPSPGAGSSSAPPPSTPPAERSDAGFRDHGVDELDVAYGRIAIKLQLASKARVKEMLGRIAQAPPGATGGLLSYLRRSGTVDPDDLERIRATARRVGSCPSCKAMFWVRGPKAKEACPRCGTAAPSPLLPTPGDSRRSRPAGEPGGAAGSGSPPRSPRNHPGSGRSDAASPPPPGAGSAPPGGSGSGAASGGDSALADTYKFGSSGSSGSPGSGSTAPPPSSGPPSGRAVPGSGSAPRDSGSAPPGSGTTPPGSGTAPPGSGSGPLPGRSGPPSGPGGGGGSGTAASAPPAGFEDFRPGTTVADYTIQERLGEGPRGCVYRAVDPEGEPVRLKIFAADVVSAGEILTVHERADELATVEHRALSQVREAGEVAGGGLYIATEMVERGSLADPDERQALKLRLRRALEVIADVARAIQAAQDRGLLHRNVKPSNIRLDSTGSPKITDFDLLPSKADPALDAPDPVRARHLAYKAPEQVGPDREVSATSDVWSLGVVLHEILSGSVLFPGDDPTRVVEAVRESRPPSLSAENPSIHQDVDTIVRVALAPRPALRYETPGDLADDVERYLAGKPIQASPPSTLAALTSGRGPFLAGVAGALLFLVVTGFLGTWWWSASRAAALRDRIAEAEATATTALEEENPEEALAAAEHGIAAAEELGDPAPPWALTIRARRALEEGRPADALPDLDAALEQAPDRAETRALRGRVLLVLERWEEARDDLRAVRDSFPADAPEGPLVLARLGQAHEALDEVEEARAAYLDSYHAADRAGRPVPQAALVGAARILLSDGDDRSARNLCTRAIEQDRAALEAYELRAEIAMDGGEWSEARRDLRAVLRIDEDRTDARLDLATCYRREGSLRRAQETLEEVLERTPADEVDRRVRAHVGLGRIRLARGENPAAQDAFERAIELDDSGAEAHYGLARALRNRRRREEALREAQRAVELDPDMGKAHELRGALQASLERWDEALESFNQAEERGRSSYQLHYSRALIHNRREDWASALGDYQRAAELDDSHFEPFFHIARISLFEGTRNPDRALRNARRAVEISGNVPQCHQLLAEAQGLAGNVSGAIRTLEELLEWDHLPPGLRSQIEERVQFWRERR